MTVAKARTEWMRGFAESTLRDKLFFLVTVQQPEKSRVQRSMTNYIQLPKKNCAWTLAEYYITSPCARDLLGRIKKWYKERVHLGRIRSTFLYNPWNSGQRVEP